MPPLRFSLPALAVFLAVAFPPLVSRHTLPLATFYGEWASLLLFALSAWLLCSLATRAGQRSEAPLLPIAALFPLWLILTGLLQAAAGMPDITGSRLLTQLALALGAVVMLAAWRYGQAAGRDGRRHLLDALAAAWLVAGLLGTLAQWAQVFHLEPGSLGLVSSYFYDDNRRLWGNLNQPNHQATVEGLALAASVWLAARGRLGAPAWLAAALLLESGIVLSGSRTGVLHVGLATLCALLMAWLARAGAMDGERGRLGASARRAGPLARPAGLLFAAVALVAGLLVLQPLVKAAGQAFGWNLFDTIAQLQAADQISSRGALWTHAWAMFRSHPWLGVGWGEFGWAQFEQLALVGVTAEMSLHAHNAVLDLLAKTGLVGTVGVLLVLAGWLWRVVRARLWRGDADERAQSLLALTWLAMLCAHSMLEYPLHYAYFLLPFCFLIAWLEPSGLVRWQPPRAARRLAAALFVLAAGVVLATMWQDYRRLEAREYAGSAKRAGLPLPRFWFQTHAGAERAELARITPANAAALLPGHLAAVHLLPTPEMIARTAWLMALTGKEAQARVWLMRLRFYYAGDEAAQYATVNKACTGVRAEDRPEAFCDWVRKQAASHQED
ncbi:ligase [Cupriavidus sp. USMAA2-4]|uniref:Ligase n=1 Tax=Cupriavidus malaysiensis TaxID=367825 RepID=A0ABN4TJW4_9BURK|nr:MULTISPECIES: O-antigen ligase family protein [Cupriavidus]AOY91675.1 ligase [Cupriavidus sp. USMAA2-4]AOY98768.1 ligase [Cupriavidus sp. USMAHM13]AOZ05200.1 ligase [Cupriavidus malaysiensis]